MAVQIGGAANRDQTTRAVCLWRIALSAVIVGSVLYYALNQYQHQHNIRLLLLSLSFGLIATPSFVSGFANFRRIGRGEIVHQNGMTSQAEIGYLACLIAGMLIIPHTKIPAPYLLLGVPMLRVIFSGK